MFFHIRYRSQQAFFFTTPERNADRAPGLHTQRLQDSSCLHHYRAADCVVRSASRSVPGIQVTAQHNYFISFICPGYLGNSVIGRGSFRIDAFYDIELQSDISAVGKYACDTSEVFITHHYGRYRLCDIECSVVESANLSKLSACVIDANKSTIVAQEQIELLSDLGVGKGLRCVWIRSGGW